MWAKKFSDEAARIKEVFGDDAFEIQHIGSTAVPGLAAKPTIDILVIVRNIGVVDKHIPRMVALGYKSMGAFIAEETHMFEKEVDGERIFIVHVFEQQHPHTRDMIKLRDYLINNSTEAAAYAECKRQLKEQYPDDYLSYRREKNVYITALMERVERESSGFPGQARE